MRIARKVYTSIFTTLFILITCVATSFAWVGMLTTATLGGFDLKLKVEQVEADYFLTISDSGNANSFGDTLSSTNVKRQILKNLGKNTDNYLDEGIDILFRNEAILEPVTTGTDLCASSDNKEKFYSIHGMKEGKPYLQEDKRYYKFDFYLSVDTLKGIAGTPLDELKNLDINANVFFENIADAITGKNSTDSLINQNPFSTIPSNSDYACLKDINSSKITVNSKNATRVAFQVYEPIPLSSSYTGLETPSNTIIYQAGKQLPSYNRLEDLYDLGGILPEEYNLALKEFNTIYDLDIDLNNLYIDTNKDDKLQDDEKVNSFTGALDRYTTQDLEMVEANNKIWQAPTTISGTNYLGIKYINNQVVQTKMKVTVYFWFEGYDADCLRLVDFKPTSLNILLATDKRID